MQYTSTKTPSSYGKKIQFGKFSNLESFIFHGGIYRRAFSAGGVFSVGCFPRGGGGIFREIFSKGGIFLGRRGAHFPGIFSEGEYFLSGVFFGRGYFSGGIF